MTSGSQEETNADLSATTRVERTFGEHRQGYDLSEIRRLHDRVLRVRIHRDAYQHQSYALVEVLTPAMTWTQLTSEPAPAWHPGTPYRASSPTPLEHLTEQLFTRAAAILRPE